MAENFAISRSSMLAAPLSMTLPFSQPAAALASAVCLKVWIARAWGNRGPGPGFTRRRISFSDQAAKRWRASS
jgi:hypothetical protein